MFKKILKNWYWVFGLGFGLALPFMGQLAKKDKAIDAEIVAAVEAGADIKFRDVEGDPIVKKYGLVNGSFFIVAKDNGDIDWEMYADAYQATLFEMLGGYVPLYIVDYDNFLEEKVVVLAERIKRPAHL